MHHDYFNTLYTHECIHYASRGVSLRRIPTRVRSVRGIPVRELVQAPAQSTSMYARVLCERELLAQLGVPFGVTGG